MTRTSPLRLDEKATRGLVEPQVCKPEDATLNDAIVVVYLCLPTLLPCHELFVICTESDNPTLFLLIQTGEKAPGGRKRGPRVSKGGSDSNPKEPKQKKARRSSKASAATEDDDNENHDNDDDDGDFETGIGRGR